MKFYHNPIAMDILKKDARKASPAEARFVAPFTKSSELLYSTIVRATLDKKTANLPLARFQGTENATMSNSIFEYSFDVTGRRTWYVSKDMAEVLEHAEADTTDLRNIKWPYDFFSLCFEYGTTIKAAGKEWPLRMIRVMAVQSKLGKEISQRLVKNDLEKMILFFGCFGEKNGVYSWDTDEEARRWHSFRPYLKTAPLVNEEGVESEEGEAIEKAIQMAVSAVLFYNARPSLVVPHSIPKSERNKYNAKTYHQERLIVPNIFSKPKEIKESSSAEPERHNKPHLRGWVLRTLRADRYARNPDGTCKVVLVEPCAINGWRPASDQSNV